MNVEVSGTPAGWQVVFHDASTGAALGPPVSLVQEGISVASPVSDLTDDVAFELRARR